MDLSQLGISNILAKALAGSNGGMNVPGAAQPMSGVLPGPIMTPTAPQPMQMMPLPPPVTPETQQGNPLGQGMGALGSSIADMIRGAPTLSPIGQLTGVPDMIKSGLASILSGFK